MATCRAETNSNTAAMLLSTVGYNSHVELHIINFPNSRLNPYHVGIY
jgi:hypothetical protein